MLFNTPELRKSNINNCEESLDLLGNILYANLTRNNDCACLE